MKKKEKRHEEETSKAEDVKEKVTKEETESKNADSVIEEVEALDKKKQEYDALWDRFLRLQAEFDNYKKRSYKERVEFIKFANEGLILELLAILDNFERGIKAAELKKDFDLLHQGVDMISKQLHVLLESKGLNRIKSVGERFDPHKHEAVEVIEDEKAQEDVVVDELQPGYTLGGRIIRPARVKVVKRKEAEKQRSKEVEKEEIEKIEEEEKKEKEEDKKEQIEEKEENKE